MLFKNLKPRMNILAILDFSLCISFVLMCLFINRGYNIFLILLDDASTTTEQNNSYSWIWRLRFLFGPVQNSWIGYLLILSVIRGASLSNWPNLRGLPLSAVGWEKKRENHFYSPLPLPRWLCCWAYLVQLAHHYGS